MGNQRLVWADALKGCLILLVVLGHAIQQALGDACYQNHLWNIIYSFHMPAFMAVSGFFAYHKNGLGGGTNTLLKSLFRRFRQLVIPFILWTILFLLINSQITWLAICQKIVYPDGGLWFLWVLFIISAIFNIGIWLSDICHIRENVVLIIIALCLVAVMVLFDVRLFGYQFIAYYFLFYLIGFLLHKYEGTMIIHNKLVMFLLALIWGMLAWFWNMHSLPPFMQGLPIPGTLGQYGYRFITATIAIFVIFAASPLLLKKKTKWNKPLIYLGTISLGIYASHYILIGKIAKMFLGIVLSSTIVIICSFATGILISLGIVWLFSKWKVTNQLFLGKV